MARQFTIRVFQHGPGADWNGADVVVCVDVLRATTTVVTAVSQGRRCLPVTSVAEAQQVAEDLGDAVLAGELSGHMPPGFHMQNSPSQLGARTDVERPLVLLSTSGTHLMRAADVHAGDALVACLRNRSAVATHILSQEYEHVALVGAGSRGEFRQEDALCCGRLGAALVQAGYRPADDSSAELADRWGDAPLAEILASNSVGYLRRSNQLDDVDFVLGHDDDLDQVVRMVRSEATVVA